MDSLARKAGQDTLDSRVKMITLGPVHRNLLQGDPREPKDCRVIPVFQDVMDSTEESVTEEPPEDPENL